MKYDEESIVEALQDPFRQRKAFEQVVQHYTPQLYAQIRRMVFSHDDSDDILQNTYMKAWSNLKYFRGEAKLSTWLYRIAFNESLSFLQRKKENVALDDSNADIINQLMADDYFDGDEKEAIFQNAIKQLPEKQRIVFNLKYFKDMKYEEISDILGTTVGGLKASYHLAVKKIEAFLKDED